MKTLIINGHPNANSYCAGIAERYWRSLQTMGKESVILNLHSLKFDINLSNGYKNNILEPDLLNAQKLISESDHLVFIYPSWWWSMPALLKGFIERTFTPGFAFKYDGKSKLPKKLLKNKRASLIVTMDSPNWYYKIWMRSAGHIIMKRGVFDFCGISTTNVTTIDNVMHLKESDRIKWLSRIEAEALKYN